jgi:hypothetical protein
MGKASGGGVVLYLKSPDNAAHGRTRLAKKDENKIAHILKQKVKTVSFV